MILAFLKSPLVDIVLISLAVYFIFFRKGGKKKRVDKGTRTVFVNSSEPKSTSAAGEYIDYEEVK